MLRLMTRLLLPFLVLLGASAICSAGQTPLPWVARRGLSSADYQKAFDEFAKDGFELTSVSGYLDNGELRYAALWRQPPSPEPWAARHGLSAADFTKAIDDFAKDGLSLVYVDGYEVGGTPLFAGIWRKSAAGFPVVKLNMDGAQYQAEFDAMLKQGFRLQHVAGYTHNGDDNYAAIWNKAGGAEWVARHRLTSQQFQQAFNDFANQGFRLKEVSGYSPGGNDLYAGIWEKDGGPTPWIAHFGVPLADYQTQIDVDHYQGWQPLYVQAFTSRKSPRFDTIWQSPFSFADLDALQNKLLKSAQNVGVGGLSIAIARDGHLLYASGLGLADKEAGVAMNVNHRLRIGSISKTITSVTIFRLIQAGATYGGGKKLTLNSPIMGPDGILPDLQAPPQLPQFASAQLHHILEHTAGLPGESSDEAVGDPTHCAAGDLVRRINYEIAKVQPIPAPPPGKTNGGPIPRAPGSVYDYSNIDFAIAQAVIERVENEPYPAVVMGRTLVPAGLTQPTIFHIGPYVPTLGEAKQYESDGTYAEYPANQTCDNLPPNVGAGGWDMSAKDLLRYLTSVEGLPSPNILDATERADMLHSPAQDNPSDKALVAGYARGWQIGSWGACNTGWDIVQGHNGGIHGGFSDMFYLKEGGFSFVVIANQDPGVANCTPSADVGKPNPPQVSCGKTGDPPCDQEPMARIIDLIRRVDWPNYDLFF